MIGFHGASRLIDRFEARAAQAIDRRAGNCVRQAGEQRRVARDVARVFARLIGAADPQGPLKWADQIGLDEVLAVPEGLQRETGEDRYRPATLMKKLVIAGFLGETSGRG